MKLNSSELTRKVKTIKKEINKLTNIYEDLIIRISNIELYNNKQVKEYELLQQ